MDNIIENYFDTNRYSNSLMQKLERYKYLSSKENLQAKEEQELKQLSEYFKDNYDAFSIEVQSELKQLKLAKLSK